MSVPPVAPDEIVNPTKKLIEENEYFIKMFNKSIGGENVQYKLISVPKDGSDYFNFQRIGGVKKINIHKDDIDNYTFIPVNLEAPAKPGSSKPPARPHGGRRRTLRKSCNIPGAIANFLSRKYKTRRNRKH